MEQDTLFNLTACFSRPVRNGYAVRNMVGGLAEEYACALLGLQRSKIDGRKDLCEDFTVGAQGRGEIKAVRDQAIVYKWRLEKEALQEQYAYVFVNHDCAIGPIKDAQEVLHNFIKVPPGLLVATVADIQQVVAGRRLRQNPIYTNRPVLGFNRKKYAEGFWQFSLHLFPVKIEQWHVGQFAGLHVFTRVRVTARGLAWMKQQGVKLWGEQ